MFYIHPVKKIKSLTQGRKQRNCGVYWLSKNPGLVKMDDLYNQK